MSDLTATFADDVLDVGLCDPRLRSVAPPPVVTPPSNPDPSIVVTSDNTLSPGRFYVVDALALVGLTMPPSPVEGDRITVYGKGSGLWKLYSPWHIVRIGDKDTTPLSGYIGSFNSGDYLEIQFRNGAWISTALTGYVDVV